MTLPNVFHPVYWCQKTILNVNSANHLHSRNLKVTVSYFSSKGP